MSSKKLKTRQQADPKYKWNIEKMISSEDAIDSDLLKLKKSAEKYAARYCGHLTDSAETLYEAFADKDSIMRKLEKIYVYAHMKRDENNADSRYQGMTDKTMSVIAYVSASLSFFTPELLNASKKTLLGYVEENEKLQTYRFVIEDCLRQKKHILSNKEEAIMAQMSELSGSTNDIFTMLNNADITFPAPTANWGQATHFGILDAPTAGNLLYQGPLTQPKTINNGDPAPKFPAGSLVISIQAQTQAPGQPAPAAPQEQQPRQPRPGGPEPKV